MGLGTEIEIENTLRDALRFVLGSLPTLVTAVELLSAYVFSLVKDLGLSESEDVDPGDHERPEPPGPLRSLVGLHLPIDNDDALRDALYGVFVALSDAPGVGQTVNANTPLGQRELLLVAQTAWNLESNKNRPRLPIAKSPTADIPEPNSGKDFAKMTWTERSNIKGVPGRSSGDSFRKQAARLAVLAAIHLVDATPTAMSNLEEAQLVISDQERRAIAWPRSSDARGATAAAVSGALGPRGDNARILVGTFPELGAVYERRGFDDEIAHIWADGGNRRIWLRGGPGLGKSYTARRVMQESRANRGETGDELLIWVDSADAVSVTRELARAAERMPGLGLTVAPDAADADHRLARSMLECLRITDRRWLIVFDDARAEELIRQQLLPSGTNPHGRVLITTLGDSDGDTAGRQVLAEEFRPAEADGYLAARLPHTSAADRAALAASVGYHPLVLSMATATITAERMTIPEWLTEFDSVQLDLAADHHDPGGYPHPIIGTWRLALAKAAQGVADGAVERAAMVAAIQDPAGHPSWLWQRDAVRDWVDAGAGQPQRRSRIHQAVRRLVDFGILQVIGNWSDGRITIHQMAARAVREAADPARIAEIASILAKEWILVLTRNPESAQAVDIAAAARPLSSLPGRDSFTQDAVSALLGFSDRSSGATIVRWMREELDELEPLLLRGGAIGRIDLAERHTSVGQGEFALGRHVEARGRFTIAYRMYEQLFEDASLDDDQRAKLLESMAELNVALDRAELGQDQKQSAVRLRERLAEVPEPPTDRALANLIALTDLHEGLADDHRSIAALDRAMSLQAASATSALESADVEAQLARRLATRGRLPEAIEHMRRAARLYEQSAWGRVAMLQDIRRELGMLQARQGEWKKAERSLKRGEANPVLLASVQLQMGDEDAALVSLATAAARCSPSALPESEDEPVPVAIRELRTGVLRVHFGFLAQKAMKRRRWDDAADLAAVNLEIARVHVDSSTREDQAELASAYFTAGVSALMAGRHTVAVELLTSGINIYEVLAGLSSGDAPMWRKLAQAQSYLAQAHIRTGDLHQAIDSAARAVGILEHRDPADPDGELDLALQTLGLAHAEAGLPDDALAVYIRRVDVIRRGGTSDPRNSATRAMLADVLGAVIWACVTAERWSEALDSATELVELRQTLADEDPDNVDRQGELAGALLALGVAHDHLGGLVESEAFSRRAVAIRRALLDRDPSALERQAGLAYELVIHAESLSKLNRDVDAAEALTAAVDHLALPAELNPEAHVRFQIEFLRALSTALRRIGRDAEADVATNRALDLAHRFPGLQGD